MPCSRPLRRYQVLASSHLLVRCLLFPGLLATLFFCATPARCATEENLSGRAVESEAEAASARASEVPGQVAAMPWRQAGLDARQAAAHLLDRFAFGARPGDLEVVVEMGLDHWLEQQLRGDFSNPELDRRLARLHSLGLSAREIAETYPQPTAVLREAQRAGVIEDARQILAAALEGASDGEPADRGRARREALDPEQRRELLHWAKQRGYRPAREALYELQAQKLARAVYGQGQLEEVLTDFWFDHFNVSITDRQARIYVWPYERDAIRPHVLGNFADMLEATAQHPAMLHYLDNVRSAAEEGVATTFDRQQLERLRGGRGGRGAMARASAGGLPKGLQTPPRLADGLNENYARELMELHTLGVDGGYDQDDVVAVARAFTGWSTYPPEGLRDRMQRTADFLRARPQTGFVFEEAFVFRADVHDAEEKVVLGHTLAAGRGMEDGLDVLSILAGHPSTARLLARKMAIRFVSDAPPARLVDHLAETFLATSGDLGAMVRAIAHAPEFWAEEARGAKIKSPFGLAASALRMTGAKIEDPRAVLEWVGHMGQPLYAYQAPTGYPDRADAWVSSGSLLSRMRFGLQLATGQVPGIELDLDRLAGQREPESAEQALRQWVPLLLPERQAASTVARLEAMVRDPGLDQRIADAALAADDPPTGGAMARSGPETWDDEWDLDPLGAESRRPGRERRDRAAAGRESVAEPDTSLRARVVGVILGSPEFQRR